MHLRESAGAQGDTETYISLVFHPPILARRTVVGRVADMAAQANHTAALDVLDGRSQAGRGARRMDAPNVNVLMHWDGGRMPQAHRLARFAETLDSDMLRATQSNCRFRRSGVERTAKAQCRASKI